MGVPGFTGIAGVPGVQGPPGAPGIPGRDGCNGTDVRLPRSYLSVLCHIYIYIDVRTSQTYGPDWFRVSLVRVVIPERLVPAVFEVLLG